MKMTKEYLDILEKIDGDVTITMGDINYEVWKLFVSARAAQAGVPKELIDRYVDLGVSLEELYEEVKAA